MCEVRPCNAFICGLLLMNSIGTFEYGFDKHMWDVPRDLYDRAALVCVSYIFDRVDLSDKIQVRMAQ